MTQILKCFTACVSQALYSRAFVLRRRYFPWKHRAFLDLRLRRPPQRAVYDPCPRTPELPALRAVVDRAGAQGAPALSPAIFFNLAKWPNFSVNGCEDVLACLG